MLRFAGTILLLTLAACVAVDHADGGRDDWTQFDHKSFLVSRVVDGDTVHVKSDGGAETVVRFIGVDAAEMNDPSTGQPGHWATRATEYVNARAVNRSVTLRLEPIQTRDRYGRLLAYVYLSDIDCLNMDLVRDGQAYADRRFRHSFRPQYEQAENEARRKQRGLWKDVTEEKMPAWRRVWLHQRDG